MSHIVLQHSLGDALDAGALMQELHSGFCQLDTITPAAVKTCCQPLDGCLVGTDEQPDNMIHVILRMKPGRSHETRHMLCQWLHDTIRAYVNARGLETTLSIEPLDMDYDFYKSSHA